MPSDIVIIGPPGTGKTTAAVMVASDWFRRGAGPDEVAYLAFTKAAAKEAASRINPKELGLELGESGKLPYFRTIHSLAYMGMSREKKDLRLITTKDMKLFSAWASMEGKFAVEDFEDLAEVYQKLQKEGRSRWDNCLTGYTLSRISARTPEELEMAKTKTSRKADGLLGRSFSIDEYRYFVAKYEDFKRANGLIDFTDMLEYALTEMEPLSSVRYAVIDEVQDCAPILFSITERLFQDAEQIWWAGDVNQTIYSFSAADPKLFIQRARKATHRIILRQTHRFGRQVVDLSRRIIERAVDRILVDVIGVSGKSHSIRESGSFEPILRPMLLLHRHVKGCQALGAAYVAAGLPFRNERGRDPLDSDKRVTGFQAMRTLAAGKEASAKDVGDLIEDMMPSVLQPEPGVRKGKRLIVHGAKKKIQTGVLKGEIRLAELVQGKFLTEDGADVVRSMSLQVFKHADDLEYYRRVMENGHTLNKDDENIPRITTIHGSKGREAESVVVFTEMGMKCWEDTDSEHRLAYVAATRTKGDLEFCGERTLDWANTRYNYPIEDPKEAPTPLGEIDAADIEF